MQKGQFVVKFLKIKKKSAFKYFLKNQKKFIQAQVIKKAKK